MKSRLSLESLMKSLLVVVLIATPGLARGDDRVEWKPLDPTHLSMKVPVVDKAAAAQITGDATTADKKLERLYEFCRSQIKNINSDASGLTDADLEKFRENKSPADTFKRRIGTGTDINYLFAALATAAGFDARLALLPDRGSHFFNPQDQNLYLSLYFLRANNIAILVDNKWRFFDPATIYLPYGMLRWQEESMNAMIVDPVSPIFTMTPLAPPEKTIEKRTATLRLDEEGVLEGDITVSATGHLGVDRKQFNDDLSPEEREQNLRDQIKARLSIAEISNIRIENVTDPVKPFTYSYHVRAPGYAQRTGKRLFLQPAYFQRGVGALLPTSERRHAIYFHYPWYEDDSVSIELPAGFTADTLEAPEPWALSPLGKYEIKLAIEGRFIEYRRSFYFCGGGIILFPIRAYSQLKGVFDLIHERDNRSISLKQSASAGN
jgi:transglutaminase superfamily protein